MVVCYFLCVWCARKREEGTNGSFFTWHLFFRSQMTTRNRIHEASVKRVQGEVGRGNVSIVMAHCPDLADCALFTFYMTTGIDTTL